jgi:hypothetical protein
LKSKIKIQSSLAIPVCYHCGSAHLLRGRRFSGQIPEYKIDTTETSEELNIGLGLTWTHTMSSWKSVPTSIIRFRVPQIVTRNTKQTKSQAQIFHPANCIKQHPCKPFQLSMFPASSPFAETTSLSTSEAQISISRFEITVHLRIVPRQYLFPHQDTSRLQNCGIVMLCQRT